MEKFEEVLLGFNALRMGVDGLLGAYIWGPLGGLFVGGAGLWGSPVVSIGGQQ